MARQVVVTGGSSGLGRATAARFAAAGDEVIVAARGADALERTAAGIGARAVRCDLSDPADAAALVDALPQRVDVLVAFAGGNTDLTDSRGESPPEVAAAWRANFAANVLSTVLAVSAVAPRMGDGGAIVTVGSIGAEYAGSSYGAMKAAVSAWTAGLSATLGPRGITANTVSPGYIEDTAFFAGRLTAERRERLIAATHNGRAGRPDDIAETVFFLASDGARHLTGQTVHVNGGAHTTR